MKTIKLILIACLLLVQGVSFAQNGFTNKDEAKNFTDSKGLKQGKWIEYLNQSLKKTTQDGSVCYLLTVYKNDKPQEIQRTYYNSGQLQNETPFVNGKANGLVKSYNQSGKIQSEVTMLDDSAKGIGWSRGYYPSGSLITEISLLDGKINGQMKQYFESGELQSEVPMINEKMNGVKKTYNKNGTLSSEQSWVDNKIFGVTKMYDKSNKPISEIFYNESKIVLMKTFYPSGQPLNETPFLDGKINGIMKYYKEDGSIADQHKYVNGVDDPVYHKKIFRQLVRKSIIADLKNPNTWLEFGTMVAQGLQQDAAYNNMVKNPSPQSYSNYYQVVKNNVTLSPEDAMQANNEIIINNNKNTSTGNTSITDAYNQNNTKINELKKSNDAKRNVNNVNTYKSKSESSAITNENNLTQNTQSNSGNNGQDFNAIYQQCIQNLNTQEAAEQNALTDNMYLDNTDPKAVMLACDDHCPKYYCRAHHKQCASACDCTGKYNSANKAITSKYSQKKAKCEADYNQSLSQQH